MSPKRNKTVPQLVEKYRRELPTLERPLLRRLIRLENPQLFKDNPSNLKKLDRYLGKSFGKGTIRDVPTSKSLGEEKPKEPSTFGLFGWLERRAKRHDLELRRLEAEGKIIHEIAMFWPKHGRAPTQEEKWKIQEKWGKRYKVDPGDLHPIGV